MMGGAAIPVGNDATGGLDKGDWRLNIIGLQARFDDQIDLPRGHQSISIAIHPKARQTRMSRHLGKGGPFGCRPDFWKSSENGRL